MLVLETEMHIITLLFVILELVMFGIQLGYYFNQPENKPRFYYLILLFLLLLYNITGGLFPDPGINSISVQMQTIIAYGSGFLMASYFPFYFYKAFDLTLLRFHAIYGVPLFLLLPYILFFVISYSINNNLDFATKYGVIIPFFYSFIVLRKILIAIRVRFKKDRKEYYFAEEIAVYCAVAPWASMTVITYFQASQLVEVLFTNLGLLIITGIFILKSAKQARNNFTILKEITNNGIRPELFLENCAHFQLTAREIEVAKLLQQGYGPKEIGDCLHIAERTVTTHIQNMILKTETHSRFELIRKLENGIFSL